MGEMTIYIVIFALIWCILWGALCASIVSKKGYADSTCVLYFFFGFFLTFIAALLAYGKEDLNGQSRIMEDSYRYQRSSNTWVCICGTRNNLTDNQCQNCGKSQYSVTGKAPANQPQSWRCTCGAMNKEYETSCHRCGKEINEVTWNCSCGMRNHKNDVICSKCGKRAPETKKTNNDLTADNVADELKKYKEMLDEGLITEEEFTAKKKQLLGI